MKTILILGGYGFIGTNVLKYIDEYLMDSYCVIVFDKFERHSQHINFQCIKKAYAGDFTDSVCLEEIFENDQIDLVMHFLSSTVPSTSKNAKYDVESNLIPTLNLLEIMKSHNVKDIVYLSSGGAIYGDYLEKVHNEEDAVYPISSYGVVKLAIEKYMLSYSELSGFNSLILRLSNPFGPFHFNNRQGVINIAIRKALRKELLQVWGDGNGIKDYIYIKDVCKILFCLINEGVYTDVINVASGIALSVNDIILSIKKILPSIEVEYTNASATDVKSFELDITKLRKRIGSIKMTPFSEALAQTIEWQKLFA